jgi:hypothetical protein
MLSRQTYMSKLAQEAETNLKNDVNEYGETALGYVNTYLSGGDTSSNLANLCSNLNNLLRDFQDDVNKGINVHAEINKLLLACRALNTDGTVGDSVFYHADINYSHSFYKCEGTDHDTPILLYTTEPNLSSFQAAANLCYNWANTPEDLYGSYTNSCVDVLPLANPEVACLAGRDLPLIG